MLKAARRFSWPLKKGRLKSFKLLLSVEAIDHAAALSTDQQLLINFTHNLSSKIQDRMKEFIARHENPDDIKMRPDEMAWVMGYQEIADLIQQHAHEELRAKQASRRLELG